MQWDAEIYEQQHAYVYQRAQDLIELLAPQPNERVLDLGCGTGALSAQIAQRAAFVLGLDASPTMIESARRKYLHPNLQWQIGDGRDFSVGNDFDAVFSNAALHWMRPPQNVIACIYRALKHGGRLVCEFGGHGNITRVLTAIEKALAAIGRHDLTPFTNYFPTIAEYVSLLESAAMETTFAQLYERPTPLQGENGLRIWVSQFRAPLVEAIDSAQREDFWRALEDNARAELWNENGWWADYRRLRVVAWKR